MAVRGRTVAGLVLAIAVVDVVVTQFVPERGELLVKAACVAGFVWWARARVGLSWDDLGLGRQRLATGLAVGAVAALVIGVVIAVLVAIPATRSHFLDDKVAAASTAERVLDPLLVIPLGTVVFEETIFRGVLLGVLLRGWSRVRAVAVSAIVFGLWHIPPALSGASDRSAASVIGGVLGTVAVTTFAGAVFAELRVRSGSLVAPALAHVTTNSFAYVAAIVALSL